MKKSELEGERELWLVELLLKHFTTYYFCFVLNMSYLKVNWLKIPSGMGYSVISIYADNKNWDFFKCKMKK